MPEGLDASYTARFEDRMSPKLRQLQDKLERLLPRCVCWKPTAPGHQLDCPRSRPVKIYMAHR